MRNDKRLNSSEACATSYKVETPFLPIRKTLRSSREYRIERKQNHFSTASTNAMPASGVDCSFFDVHPSKSVRELNSSERDSTRCRENDKSTSSTKCSSLPVEEYNPLLLRDKCSLESHIDALDTSFGTPSPTASHDPRT